MQSEFFFFMQFLVTGLSMGSIYALVALGFVLIYKSTSILNLAQGAAAAHRGADYLHYHGNPWPDLYLTGFGHHAVG